MSHGQHLNRRAFLRTTGLTAVVGAAAGRTGVAASAGGATGTTAAETYDFDTIVDRFDTDCVKYDRQRRLFPNDRVEIGMGIADMDFRAAPSVTRALRERLEHEVWGYLDMPRKFPDSIIAWNKRRYGVDIQPDQLVISAGVHPALIYALQTFTPRGGKVLMTTPVYNGFYTDLRFAQLRAEESPLRLADGRYSIDFEDFERRISHETNTFILCNPHNPTGNCWSPEDLMRLGEICLRRRVIVLADEIHCDFVNKGQKYTPFASLPDKAIVDNSITFKAASKSFGLAAHKIAWYHSTNRDLLARLNANHRADLNTLGVVANMGAYDGGEAWLDQCVSYIDGTHTFVEEYVKSNIPLVKCAKPEGTYLVWLDMREVIDRLNARAEAEAATRREGQTVTVSNILERFFVKHARVHLNPGATFGFGGDTHMRMNIATSRKLVERALSNIAEALRTI